MPELARPCESRVAAGCGEATKKNERENEKPKQTYKRRTKKKKKVKATLGENEENEKRN